MMQKVRVSFIQCGAVFILALLLAPFSQAQTGNPVFTGSSRSDTLQIEQRRQYESAMIEQALEASRVRKTDGLSINLAEFRADFLKLQVVNNSLWKSVAATEPLNLKYIAKSTGEIRKIGKRLKASRALPRSEETTQAPQAAVELGQLRSTLANLDKLIVEFVRNPIFASSKVLDAQLAARARSDLDQIIQLSGELKKTCANLGRAGHAKLSPS